MADYDIFISYRRVGGKDFARQMQLALKNKRYVVFLDLDELKDGVFDHYIEAAIKSSKVFLFILSPHSLDDCKNDGDWVRLEIECALLSQCHIVPVNPNAEFKGFDGIDGLPNVIKNGLGQHQISTVMMNDLFECTFNEFVQHRIAPIVAPHGHLPHTISSEVHIETDIACRVIRYNEELITAQPKTDNLIQLKNGTHKLTFVSLENEKDSYSVVYTVKYDCEYLQVNLIKIRDARLAKEEAERNRIALEDAKQELYIGNFKYGYKKDGIIVIPAIYDNANAFSEGLASVRLEGKWGYIDRNGKEVIPFKYDNAWPFSEGLALIEFKGKWGYIDRSGKEVIPIKYEYAEFFSEGLAAVKLKGVFYLKGKWGYIDKTGKEVIPIKYECARSFSDELAAVKLKGIFYHKGKWGYIDRNGKEVIPIKYDDAWPFSEGLARVCLKGKCGYIDKNGKEVIPFKYDDALGFCNGKA
ncbi:MAG: WG repeat-containing protein, partial [Muribaculaceae bacterium]